MTNAETTRPDIFLFAGEQSGDIHGGKLIDAIRSIHPSFRLTGVGGPRMRKAGLQPLLKMEEFQVMGFTDVLKSFPKLWKNFHKVRDDILKRKPHTVVLIDYPGFNLRLAKALRKKGYRGKIVQYICPSVWAWGHKRIDVMASNLDLLLTVYPFEPPYFSHTNLSVKYIGHPLVDAIAAHKYRDDWYFNLGIQDTSKLIALFPGSREGEIIRNLPIQLQAALLLREELRGIQFAISTAQPEHRELINSIIRATPDAMTLDIIYVPGQFNYELMRDSRSAIAKSGTITLELALHCCPTVVIYHLTKANRFFAKYLLGLNLPYYCIVNILKDMQVFPELISQGCEPEEISRQLLNLHNEGQARRDCIRFCNDVKELLKTSNSSTVAAEKILEAKP